MAAAWRDDYAGVVSRTVAYLVDVFVVGVLTIVGVAGAQLVTTVVGAGWRDLARAAAPVFLAAAPALFALYNVLFWGLAGRTPGMALLGLRVTSTAGRRVRWMAALVRALVLAYFPVGGLWCLVDRRRQAVHDKLARTLVVRTVPAPLPASR
jgi:uncharacterized RDD family membrane protein YckC